MEIIICEDTKSDSITLCNFINKYFSDRGCPVELISFENGDSFLTAFKAGRFQIAFLDIYMPGISGVDLAKKIRETDKEIAIIFTTTSRDHALDGFAVKAYEYLLKPFAYEKVEQALDGCQKLFAEALRFIEVPSDRLKIKVLLKDLMYVEIYDHHCLLHTTEQGNVKTKSSLDEIEDQLALPFLRCHRSYIVNMRYVASIADEDFMMRNGDKVPIRRADRLEVKQAYWDYAFSVARGEAVV